MDYAKKPNCPPASEKDATKYKDEGFRTAPDMFVLRRNNAHAFGALQNASLIRRSRAGRFEDVASHSSMIATARVQPAEARSILTGKQDTVKPLDGKSSRLCSFSMWQ